MNKKEKIMLENLVRTQSISLKNFLISYCNITNTTLLNSKIKHKDIKELLPDLKKVSYEYVFGNLQNIYTGNVILVRDSYNNVAPYVNPKIEYYEEIIIDVETNNETIVKNDIAKKDIELEDLNLYELSLLSKRYKDNNNTNSYRKVCRIIKEKKEEETGEYHHKKEKMLKRRYEDDKY